MLPYFALLLVLLALLFFFTAALRQRAAGLPGGRIIYTDTHGWNPLEKPLYDADLGLTGKPDYLVEKGKDIIPVEVKSSRLPEAPYDAHIYQVAAYCVLVERVMGKRPPYGIIHYTDRGKASRTFAVDFTSQLEDELLSLLTEIRSLEHRKEVERSHEVPARCARCGYRSLCEERL
jgi:CRISPR-associated exonuclease Cas4